MIKVICDKCGGNCDRTAYDIQIGAIHNPTPLYANDTGEAKITDDNTRIRFVLCQKCYSKIGLPNIYKTANSGMIEFAVEHGVTGYEFSRESEAGDDD